METELVQGTKVISSTRGVSSHQHNPFCAVSVGPPQETCGEIKGFSFVYSGNFQVGTYMCLSLCLTMLCACAS